MQNTQSLRIHVLLLIIGGLTQCWALKQISVVQGDTLTLTCRLRNSNKSDKLEWKNPEGFILFFNKKKALKDKRTKLVTLTDSKFSIQITDIQFKDGGVYKCTRYNHQTSSEEKYKVIVIGPPKVELYEQDGKTMLKCSASANEHPPILSWLLDNGLEIEAHPYYMFKNKDNKYTAVNQLSVKVPTKRVSVKCLARHSALYGSKLETFIHLGNQNQDTSTLSTTVGSSASTVISTIFTSTSFTKSNSELETTNYNNTTLNKTTVGTSNGTTILKNTTENETTELISETTEGTPSNTSIWHSNNTGNDKTHFKTHIKKGNSVLLVLLVTCLIICLVVVLAFFLVRLRKAHFAWKKQNEESDQSVESSKSKSSNEERQKQQQTERGFWNTSFTKYKAEETLEAQTTPVSVHVINDNPQHFISTVKETEL